MSTCTSIEASHHMYVYAHFMNLMYVMLSISEF